MMKKRITVFDGRLSIEVPPDDWEFLCEKEFYTYNPESELVLTEFVTGTGITPSKRHLWAEASERFAEHVACLRKIKSLDLCKMCRDSLKNHSDEDNG